jgi:hypothetical protein
MKLNCLELLSNISISSYLIEFDSVNLEIKNIQVLSYKGISNWKKEEFSDKNKIFELIPKEDFENAYKKLNILKNQNYLELTYRFYTKENKIINVKSRLNVIERNENLIKCIGINEDITDEETYKSIYEKLKDSPSIGVMLYRDEIIYVNNYLKQIFQIKDCNKYKLVDFIKGDIREIQNYINKRKAGEDVFFYRERIEFISTDNKRYYLNSYANTILYHGKYVGFALLTDETKEVKKERFLYFIREISENILTVSNKKDFLIFIKNTINKYYDSRIYQGVQEDDIIIEDQGKILKIAFKNILPQKSRQFLRKFNSFSILSYFS